MFPATKAGSANTAIPRSPVWLGSGILSARKDDGSGQRIGFGCGAFPFFSCILFVCTDDFKVRQGLWLSTIWTRRGLSRSRPRSRIGHSAMSSVEALVQVQVQVRMRGV
jgi:hypothetical protein